MSEVPLYITWASGVSSSMTIDSCITQLKAQGPSRTCNESKEEVCITWASGVSSSTTELILQVPT